MQVSHENGSTDQYFFCAALDLLTKDMGKSASSSVDPSWERLIETSDDYGFVVLTNESDPLVPLTIFTTHLLVACASYVCYGVNTGNVGSSNPVRFSERNAFAKIHDNILKSTQGLEAYTGKNDLLLEQMLFIF